eukprot:m.101987 g.101987  ORF g.101987 m.101987 type:complete len:331 (+) comp15673_c0_seq1:151-1143(+)
MARLPSLPRLALTAASLLLVLWLLSSQLHGAPQQPGVAMVVAAQPDSKGASRHIAHPRDTAIKEEISDLPWIYLITPTYARLTQKADLTRMCHTLKLVPNNMWIVIEDADEPTALVTHFLERCGVPYRHLTKRTPRSMQRRNCTKVDPRNGCPAHLLHKEAELWTKPRGVEQRNAGLEQLRQFPEINGVVYFADDDNTYSLELFDKMRYTKRVSVWPVGLSGGVRYEGPKVIDGVVVGFYVGWRPDRKFPVDMAGFAVNAAEVVARPTLMFNASVERGFLESTFIGQVVSDKKELEPLSSDSEGVMAWHTHTQEPDMKWDSKVSKPFLEV